MNHSAAIYKSPVDKAQERFDSAQALMVGYDALRKKIERMRGGIDQMEIQRLEKSMGLRPTFLGPPWRQ